MSGRNPRIPYAAGLGISKSTLLPDEWAPDRNVAWKTPVPGLFAVRAGR